MSPVSNRPTFSRRGILKLLSIAGITAAGAYLLYEYAPWLNTEEEALQVRQPLGKDSTTSATLPMRPLIRYATLAASGHNTQPWKFAIRDDLIEIHPDYSRRLSVVDSDDRELWISLGCALENLLVAARAAGYTPEVTYPNIDDVIRVRLAVDTPRPTSLFDAIVMRQNTRSAYDGQPIKAEDLKDVQALQLEPGVMLHYVLELAQRERVLEYVNEGNMIQYADKPFVDELVHWLRFNKREAMTSLDGLFTRSSGNAEVPRWLGHLFVSGTSPQQQADSDSKKLRSSPGALVIAAESDDKAAWIRTGQVYERLALKMTSLNIKSAFLNQPIEVPNLRSQFQSAMGLGVMVPQLLLRFGYADTMPRSLRRPIDQVIMMPEAK